MGWNGVREGIHLFKDDKNVTGETYLEMLSNVIWPQIKSVTTRKYYYFQQDDATWAVRDWLTSNFKERVIKRFMDIP